MANWQRKARLFIAIGGLAFAVALAFAFRDRVGFDEPDALTAPDPKAIVESKSGCITRLNKAREEVELCWEGMVTYQDGSSKMFGVVVNTERGDRLFTIKGEEGTVGDNGTSYTIAGNVTADASDGLSFKTDRATYHEGDGRVVVPGRADFSRGRMRGSAAGMTYDNNDDSAVFERDVVLHMESASGGNALDLTAARAELSRPARIIRFPQSFRAVRAEQTVEADAGIAYLTEDEEHLERLELRSNARITGTQAAAGALQSMSGRDINLSYASDGQTLQQAEIIADAVVQIAGETDQQGRRISSQLLTITMSPDGTTPASVVGRERVELLLPGSPGELDRAIRAQSLDASGEPGRGLTNARFTGAVQFAERGGKVDRGARSGLLEVTLAAGLGAIEEARFSRGVRFVDGPMTATSASARYDLDSDSLELTGSEPGAARPHVDHEQLTVDAARIDVILTGPVLKAAGDVKSEIRPAKSDDSRMPSMLKQDRPVIVTAGGLMFDEPAGRAVYTGTAARPAILNQGDTTIKAVSIVVDEKNGDLSATGSVTTTFILEEEKDGKVERVPSTASAEDFKYQEADRRATYTGRSHVTGPQGDLTAEKIELFLKESGDELERVEAYDNVTLRDDNGKTTGNRFTYRDADQTSVLIGAPFVLVDHCGRQTTGIKLTHHRGTDKITVETGTGQPRTQGAGRTQCP